MITVPVSASMYQTMVANIQQIHTQSDGTIQVLRALILRLFYLFFVACQFKYFNFILKVVTPMVHVPKVEPGSGQGNDVETLATHQIVMSTNGSEPQVLQVLSLKDAAALTKALSQPSDMKTEESSLSGD